MEPINSSYVNAYDINNINSASLERIATAREINRASDDASGLAIANQLLSEGNVLSQTIANSNSGIALSQIAQSGLESQQNILSEIQTLTIQANTSTTSQEGREAIAGQISNFIDEFERIAESTTYNGESLLQTNGDSSDDLSIVGEEEIVEISRADTTSISDSLRSFLDDFSTDATARENLFNAAEQGQEDISSFATDFGTAQNALEVATRNSLQSEIANRNASSTILDVDYAREVADFSSNNLLAQIGYIMQVQPNAQQQQTIALLR